MFQFLFSKKINFPPHYFLKLIIDVIIQKIKINFNFVIYLIIIDLIILIFLK